MNTNQLVIKEVYLHELGITKEDWNIAIHLFCIDGEYSLEYFTLERVLYDSGLKTNVLCEISTAKRMYVYSIADCKGKGKYDLAKTLEGEYNRLRSEPNF